MEDFLVFFYPFKAVQKLGERENWLLVALPWLFFLTWLRVRIFPDGLGLGLEFT